MGDVCLVPGAHMGQSVNHKINQFPPILILVLVLSTEGSPLKQQGSLSGLEGIQVTPQKAQLHLCQQH